jgi:hypothetical protein
MKTKLLLFLLLFPLALSAQTVTVQNRVLKSSTFQAQGHGGGASTSCTGSCYSAVPILAPARVVCPAPPGQTCTFAIEVQSLVRATPNDIGLFQYVGDGVYLGSLPGSVENASYVWQIDGDDAPKWQSVSFTITVTVRNSAANQSHQVEMDLACYDGGAGDGCAVATGPWGIYYPATSIRIDVFRP